jgi:ribosomal protein L12E/L44/L45/RPP1/RPP2
MKTKTVVSALVALLAVSVVTLRADITTKSTITSKGMVGLTNMEGTQQSIISGDKAKVISNIKMTSKVMKFLGAGKPRETDEITRLDKELFWYVDNKEKKYEEKTFAEIRAEMEKALAEANKEKEKELKKHPEDSIQLRGEVKVDRTGKTQKIAGYNTEETIITYTVYGKNAESKESGAFKVEMDLWLAKDAPGGNESNKYYASLANKLGFTGHSQQSMEGMLTAFGIDPRELYKHTKDLQGTSLMSTVSVLAAADTTGAATGTKSEAKESPKEEKSEEADKPSGMSALKGMFGKKKDTKKSEEAGSDKQQAASGPSYLMQFTTTVTEISTGSIPASEFEIPAGYSKK